MERLTTQKSVAVPGNTGSGIESGRDGDRLIRVIKVTEIDELVNILVNAYPGAVRSSPQERARLAEEILQVHKEPGSHKYYGAFQSGRMVGTMRLFDYQMNLRGQVTRVGGVGFVGVDLLHKKERVAYALIREFLTHYRARDVGMTLLYAFRTDFYHQMGFGHGPQIYEYKLPPSRFPKGTGKAHIVRLSDTDADKVQLLDYYQRRAGEIHGLIQRTAADITALLASSTKVVLGFREGKRLAGYMVAAFQPENPQNALSNNLHVSECLYDAPEVLAEFFAFLHTQHDQLRYVIWDTHDPDFYQLFGDARDDSDAVLAHGYNQTNTAGMGLMYRVVNARKLFVDLRAHHFGAVSATIRFILEDPFLPDNAGPLTVRFTNGNAALLTEDAPCDFTVQIGVAPFSSLVMGVVPFTKLVNYGRAAISHREGITIVDQIFRVGQGPVCLTAF